MSEPYWSWRWWIRWFVPLPLLVRISKKQMGNHHVWYQDKDINLETIPRDNSEMTPEALARKACARFRRLPTFTAKLNAATSGKEEQEQ